MLAIASTWTTPISLSTASVRLLCLLVLCAPLGLVSCTQGPVNVEEMDPKRALTGAQQSLKIYGSGFPTTRMEIKLKGAANTITLTDATRIDDKTLEAKLPADAPVGAYDLEVSFAGQKEPFVLGGAFEVLSSALRVYFIDVGQGDATLLISPTQKTMLIDAGPPDAASRIEAVLSELGIRDLDHVLVTHYDADHVGGLNALMLGPDGKKGTQDDHLIKEALWDRGGTSKNFSYRSARERFVAFHKPLDGSSADSFPSIDLGGGVKVKVVTTNGVVMTSTGKREQVNCLDDENCRSLGTMVTIGSFRLWTAGDLTGGGIDTPDIETTLAKHIGKVDVYRAHHHGSRTSSNSKLLEAMVPQVVVVSAGKDNRYCHPSRDFLTDIFGLSGAWVFVTTEGIASAPEIKTCGKSTKERLEEIGTRGIAPTGSFLLSADQTGFSVNVNGAETKRWKTQSP